MSTTYTQHFEIRKRQVDGKEFSCLKDDAPLDLIDLVRNIHINYFYECWPNDWIYGTIHAAFDALEQDDIDNITIDPDIYNAQVYLWLLENGNAYASAYCNDYMDEFGDDVHNITKMISGGQWLAMDKIYHAVNEYMQEQKETPCT